jgi:hypothetical protein
MDNQNERRGFRVEAENSSPSQPRAAEAVSMKKNGEYKPFLE